MSKRFKTVCVLLCVALIITCMPTLTLASDGSFSLDTEIESGGFYRIENYNDFKTFIKLINQRGQTCEGATFALTSDIVINDGVFSLDENNTPLYNGKEITEESDLILCESALVFKGELISNGYSISGLYMTSQGLFSEASSAKFMNIKISNSLFDLRETPVENVGALCGVAENSFFSNITFDGIIINRAANTGGIVGKANTCSYFQSCKNNGTVIGSDYCGGIVGLQNETEWFVDCINNGKVISDGSYVGGLTSTIGTDVTGIDGCTNVGSVESTGDYIGGIAGAIELDGYEMKFCYHTGSVSGNDYVGGFAGSFYTPGDNLESEARELGMLQSRIEAYRDIYVGDGYEYAVYPPTWAVDNDLVYLFNERDYYIDYIQRANYPNLYHSYSAGDVTANGEYIGALFGKFDGCVWRCHNVYYNREKGLLISGSGDFEATQWDIAFWADQAAYYLPPEGVYSEREEVLKSESFAKEIGSEQRSFMVDGANENNGFVMLEDHHDISLHIHSYAFEVTTAATCVTKGVKTYTCVCGDTYTEELPLIDHKYVHRTSEPATCTSSGKSHYRCSVCGDSYIKYTPAALGHSLHKEIVKSATCKEDGLGVTTCNRCDYYEEKIIKSANQHTWTDWEYLIYPTGWSDGLEMRVCTTCSMKEEKVIPSVLSELQATHGMISGFEAGSTLEYASSSFNMDESVSISSDQSSNLGTGSVITITYGDGTQEEFEVVIYGDTNGDSWYDGQDAIIVDCLANGMLTKEDVGEAVWAAADCNHDGVIDQLDVEIINQAGTMLSDIDQTMPTETLVETASYISYSNLIDQSPEIIIEDDESIVEKEEIPDPEAGTEKTELEASETPVEKSNTFVDFFNSMPDFLAMIFKWLIEIFA
ncbi:MAG: dockerin type I repeat-containing protein [Clostridia bacterium]|nr:dockerin type I repeat-containing protein [Clostridia bacterium]